MSVNDQNMPIKDQITSKEDIAAKDNAGSKFPSYKKPEEFMGSTSFIKYA